MFVLFLNLPRRLQLIVQSPPAGLYLLATSLASGGGRYEVILVYWTLSPPYWAT
jgi:hypothetical protein